MGGRSCLFADTVGDANTSASLYSSIETAKANNIEPYHDLVVLFKKLPLVQSAPDYEALLPSTSGSSMQWTWKTFLTRPTVVVFMVDAHFSSDGW